MRQDGLTDDNSLNTNENFGEGSTYQIFTPSLNNQLKRLGPLYMGKNLCLENSQIRIQVSFQPAIFSRFKPDNLQLNSTTSFLVATWVIT